MDLCTRSRTVLLYWTWY